MSKKKRKSRIKALTILVICLDLILGACLVFGIVGKVRGPVRVQGFARASHRGLPKAALKQIQQIINMANDTAEARQNETSKKKDDSAEEGLLNKPEDKDKKEKTAAKAGPVAWDDSWEYAGFSQIHTGSAVLYKASGNRKNVTVAVNAGHGTQGGESVYTQCHPDGSAKVTGGSTAAGATQATAVSSGTTLSDSTSEAAAVLALAQIVRDDLLAAGYDVLMIRDGDDVQLDNVARTVMANNNADCHISLHYDSSTSDKGFFYTSVPEVASYKSMEPVASHWQQHNALGESILAGVREAGVKISGGGSMAIDLTQTSYSTIPSVDLEVGDQASDHSPATQGVIAQGIVKGIEKYFK